MFKTVLVASLTAVCAQSQNLRQSGEAYAGAQAAQKKAAQTAQKRREIMKNYLVDTDNDIVLPWTVQEQATHISEQDADATLSKILSGRSKDRVVEFKALLAPMYRALPKDREGLVEQRAARYALHRLFVKRHNWVIKGLEPNGDVWHQDATEHSIKDWVPAFLLDHMKKGLSLDDVAALGAAIEELIRQESDSTLEDIYKAFNLSHSSTRPEAHTAISAAMVLFLGSGAWTLERAETLIANFRKEHLYWNDTQDWVTKIENSHLGESVEASQQAVDFTATAKVVNDVAASYGSYNEAECQKLKTKLKGTWSRAETTGRVRLVDFYKLGMATEWNLNEKVDFLRSMGALDESNATAPMVIIPNYLGAMPNCLQATNMYAICCRNECESYLSKMEEVAGHAAAPPQQIADLARSLAGVELSPQLLGRLHAMAEKHGGQVQLHGRLFAQWMHHVFPNECPYPHVAGASDPVTPDEWMSEGKEVEASEAERHAHIASDTCGPEQAAAEWVVELPWSDTEELLSFEAQAQVRLPGDTAAPKGLLLLLVLLLGAALVAAARLPSELRRKYVALARVHQKVLLLGAITVLAFATNAVNRPLVIFIFISGIVLKYIQTSGASCSGPALDKEKICV